MLHHALADKDARRCEVWFRFFHVLIVWKLLGLAIHAQSDMKHENGVNRGCECALHLLLWRRGALCIGLPAKL